MSKHTPGPWKFGVLTYDENDKFTILEKDFDYRGPGYYENPSIYGPDNTDVVGCDEYYIFNSPADACLITAAPDMLEALYAIEACRGPFTVSDAELADAWDKIEKAIAKAIGEKS